MRSCDTAAAPKGATRRASYPTNGNLYYNPNTQRWLNRDPIQKAGG